MMYAKISSPSRPASQALITRSTSFCASSLWIAFSCFFAFASRGCSRNSVRQDREVGHAPLLEALVVLLGIDQLDEVADGEGDDPVVVLPVGLGLLEPARERVDDVAGDGRLLGEDQGLHAVHHSNGSRGHRRLKSRFL